MATEYTFSVSLLDASQNPNALQVWQSGTLTLNTSSPSTLVNGVLSLPGYYKQPIDYEGTSASSNTQAGALISGAGQSTEVQITFSFVYGYDGFLFDGSYLGGLMNMLDFNAQETYLYVIQGLSPQGPFDAAQRRPSVSSDTRKAAIARRRPS